jgi:hypothetical protein
MYPLAPTTRTRTYPQYGPRSGLVWKAPDAWGLGKLWEGRTASV